MRKGPRGGGRDRDRIIRHTIRTESEDFAKQVGLRIPEGAALTSDGLRRHREAYVAAMRAYNAGEVTRRMQSWTLPFLIRHSAFHTLDHAWEMEDKDLSVQGGAGPITRSVSRSGPRSDDMRPRGRQSHLRVGTPPEQSEPDTERAPA
jgi:hypothetical protein